MRTDANGAIMRRVFFQSASSPLLQMVSPALPLTHAINLARPL